MDDPLVTFIIPTIGRPSLELALRSLAAQTDPRWRAVVVGDGWEPHRPDDFRITTLHLKEKIGKSSGVHPSAGAVRNVAIPKVTTEWMGFLDDDDALAPGYVERLAVTSGETGLLVFPMRMPDGLTIPAPGGPPHYVFGGVGISFAVRTEQVLHHTLRFQPSPREDFEFIKATMAAGVPAETAGEVGYLVRPHEVRKGRRCLNLLERTEMKAGCQGYGCAHKCEKSLPAVPGGFCQSCWRFEDDGVY